MEVVVQIVRNKFLGALYSVLLPLALSAQERPDPKALLIRASASVFTAKTVRLAATKSYGSRIPPAPFNIAFIRGGRAREEWLYPIGHSSISLTVFDGTNLWQYHGLGNQYTKESCLCLEAFGRN